MTSQLRKLFNSIAKIFESDMDREFEEMHKRDREEVDQIKKLFNRESIEFFIPTGQWIPVTILGPNLELVEVYHYKHAEMIVNSLKNTGDYKKQLIEEIGRECYSYHQHGDEGYKKRSGFLNKPL